MKRFLDFCLSAFLILVLLPLLALIALIILATDGGPIFYISQRVGQDNQLFNMPKFRTMVNEAPVLPTDQFSNPEIYITRVGQFLRKTSLDELPQLWSVFLGHMSLVGPRPALPVQKELLQMRTANNIHYLKPGITGLAQINGRDNISDEEKLAYDLKYLYSRTFWLDLKIIIQTTFTVFSSKDISH